MKEKHSFFCFLPLSEQTIWLDKSCYHRKAATLFSICRDIPALQGCIFEDNFRDGIFKGKHTFVRCATSWWYKRRPYSFLQDRKWSHLLISNRRSTPENGVKRVEWKPPQSSRPQGDAHQLIFPLKSVRAAKYGNDESALFLTCVVRNKIIRSRIFMSRKKRERERTRKK